MKWKRHHYISYLYHQQIKHCDRCQRMQPLLNAPTKLFELQPVAVKPEVWYLVGMDLIGPFKKTTKGGKSVHSDNDLLLQQMGGSICTT